VGQPLNYGGGVGSFKVTMRTDRTELQVEEALTFTLRISGTGNLERIPRPDLRQLPSFRERFHIDNTAERYLPKEQAREFDYVLRPLNEQVVAIPSVPFVYYFPNGRPARQNRGWYQTAYANEGKEIPLKVTPARPPEPPIAAEPWMFQTADRNAVVRRDHSHAQPSIWAVALLLALPPIGCAAWYAVWKARHPVAAQLARQRRSRAAARALQTLQAIARHPAEDAAAQTAGVITSYLQQRFDFPVLRPTPAEVDRHLEGSGCPPDRVAQATAFYRSCDAARFAPAAPLPADRLVEAAEQLILSLEAEPWPARS
jgi:hypothetical protein